jgi:hypothetical protein
MRAADIDSPAREDARDAIPSHQEGNRRVALRTKAMPIKRSARTHQINRLNVVVLQFGDGGPFGLEFSTQLGPKVDTTFTTLELAKAEADKRVRDEGHMCDKFCSEWLDSN